MAGRSEKMIDDTFSAVIDDEGKIRTNNSSINYNLTIIKIPVFNLLRWAHSRKINFDNRFFFSQKPQVKHRRLQQNILTEKKNLISILWFLSTDYR